MVYHDWQTRVIKEKEELDDKIFRLDNSMIKTSNFNKLDHTNQQLLYAQFDVMKQYSEILRQRIELFVPMVK